MLTKTIILICCVILLAGVAVANEDGEDFQRTIRVAGVVDQQ